MIHTLNDGSVMRIMSARELITIPIWNGNRIIDRQHVKELERDVGDHIIHLDSGYRIVRYSEPDASGNTHVQSYIIDGQHRIQVLNHYFHSCETAVDFNVVVTEKDVANESEAIAYFNASNNSKPIIWTDPSMVINELIAALEKKFNAGKQKTIRPGRTQRPYLSVDLLREVLAKHGSAVVKIDIPTFISRVVQHNDDMVKFVEALKLSSKRADANIIDRAKDMQFMLGIDPKLKWINQIIK